MTATTALSADALVGARAPAFDALRRAAVSRVDEELLNLAFREARAAERLPRRGLRG